VERLSALALAAALGLAAAPEAAPPPPVPVVSGVVLKLPPGEDAATLEGLVAVKAGLPLSTRALRRTATLLYQLGRFSDVVIRRVPAGEGQVTLVVECLPRRVVRGLQIRIATAGPVLDREQVGRILGLAPGDEFWQGRLDAGLERLRAAYERRGYRRARIAGRAEGETQVNVEVEVEDGPPTRVGALDLGAGLGPGAAALRESFQVRPGAVLDLDALEADVKRLRLRLRREGWLRSRVPESELTLEGESARIRVPVEPGPRVIFRFVGNDRFGDPDLRVQLGMDPEQPIDEAALEAAAARLQAFYQERGWATARVEVRDRIAGDRELVLFEVDEGRRYRVGRISFPGSRARAPARLEAQLRESFEAQALAEEDVGPDAERLALASGTASRPPGRPQAEPGQAWYEPVFRQAVARLVDRYRLDGFLDAAHEGTRVALDAAAGTADVEIRIREGVQTLVESVAFEGSSAFSLPELREAARLAPGDPLSYPAVEQTRSSLLALYARRGFLYARVQEQEELSPDRTRAALRFKIEEGPQVRVASVVPSGNKRTREEVVLSTVELHPGDVYDPAVASRSQAALLRLGVFRSAGLRLNDPEVPESEKDLTVELSERPWRTVTPGLGFSIANGPRALVEFSQPNLSGMALELAARAKVNYAMNVLNQRPDLDGKPPGERVEGYGNVGLHYPRFHSVPFPLGAHLDAIGERLHRKAYDMTRVSTVLGLESTALARTTLSLQYELEVDDIAKKSTALTLTRIDVERLRFPEGVTLLQSLRPTVTLDRRDNSINPHEGWLAAFTADYSRSIGYRPPAEGRAYLLGGIVPGSQVFTDMLKLQATATGYLQVGRSLVLALSLRGGRVLPLDKASQTIGPKRFFLGGASTMRGAGEDEMLPEDRRADYLKEVAACGNSLSGLGCSPLGRSVASGEPPISEGGEAFFLAKAEARVAVRGSLEAGFFLDAGNLWLNPRNFLADGLRLHVGLGLRFVTAIGPVVLDAGFNTAPDRQLAERVWAPHFSIGLF
jgi:outer membrane protein assembly factor BamA